MTKPDGIPTSESAGGVVARREGDQIFIALTKEPGMGDVYVIPKGHIDAGETLEQAASREVSEETGVKDLVLVEKLGVLERMSFSGKEWKIIHYYLFKTEDVELVIPGEVEDIVEANWFSLDNLPKMYWPEQQKLIEDNKEKIRKEIIG